LQQRASGVFQIQFLFSPRRKFPHVLTSMCNGGPKSVSYSVRSIQLEDLNSRYVQAITGMGRPSVSPDSLSSNAKPVGRCPFAPNNLPTQYLQMATMSSVVASCCMSRQDSCRARGLSCTRTPGRRRTANRAARTRPPRLAVSKVGRSKKHARPSNQESL